MPRKLVLKRETLAELSSHDLAQVAGAAATPTCPTFTWCEELTRYCPTPYCVSVETSWDIPCVTPKCV